jgi:hypothetical protein
VRIGLRLAKISQKAVVAKNNRPMAHLITQIITSIKQTPMQL